MKGKTPQAVLEYLLLLTVLIIVLLAVFGNESSSLRQSIEDYIDNFGNITASVVNQTEPPPPTTLDGGFEL